jgi:phage gpG-like protein
MAGIVSRLPLPEFKKKAEAFITVPIPADGPLSPQVAREIGQIAVSDIKRRFMTGTAPDGTQWKPLKHARPNGGNQPLRDTGQLMASITFEASPTEITVGTNRQGARLHHFGGTVEPVNAKFLAIPLTKEAKRAGSPRRFKEKLGFQKTKTGWLMVQQRRTGKGKDAKVETILQYLLVKRVEIPARPFMGLSNDAWNLIVRVVAEDATKRWQQGKG